MWLNIAIGLLVAILLSAGAALLLGQGQVGAEFSLARFVERTLLGAVSIGCHLGLFFGLRTLARQGLRRVGLFNRLLWLDIAIGLIVVILWSAGVGLVLDEGGAKFNLLFVKRNLVGAVIFGGTLGVFFGLRALVYMGLHRISPAVKQRTSATCSSD